MNSKFLKFPHSDAPSNYDTTRESIFGEDTKYRLKEYLHLIRRHKWVIIGFTLIGGIVGFLKATSEIPIYKASLTMLIEPNRPNVGTPNQFFYNMVNPYLFYQTQYEIITSRAVAERIAEKLGVDRRPIIHRNYSNNRTSNSIIDEIADSVNDRIGLSKPQSTDVSSINKIGTSLDDSSKKRSQLTSIIKNGLAVRGGDKSQIVVIDYDSPDPQFAADVANAAADAYIELTLDARLSSAKVASGWLTERVEELRQKVAESEAKLQAFQSKEELVDTVRLRELSSGRLTVLNTEYIQAQSRVSELSKRYGSKHPEFLAASAALREIQGRLQREKTSVVATQEKSFELAKLERDVTTYRQLYDQFLTRFKESDVAAQYNIDNVRVIDAAYPPGSPYKPDKSRIFILYLFVGFVVGGILVWFREYLDNTFKTPEDVELKMKLPVLGIVPTLKKLSKKDDPVPERYYIHDTRSSFSESINHIRTGVLFSNIDDPPKVIMCTSALQAEGKTTLSSNLALSFAQLNRTLLIDADLRKPRVAEVTGLDRRGGLADVVRGQGKVSDVFYQDMQCQNLYIMKSGTQPPNPLELLSSKRFEKLLEELRKRFEHIIVDTAPILPVSDAIVLSRFTDATVLVVQSEKTSRTVAQKALNRLNSSEAHTIGVVFSQVGQKRLTYYYQEDYYGYYGQYYGRPEKGSRRSA